MAWNYNDLTAATGAPGTDFFSPNGYAFEAQGTQHVIYRQNDFQGNYGQINELWWDSGGWHHNDLTAATGAPLADFVPRGYVFEAQGTQHVVYQGQLANGSSDGHIHELWWDNNGWHHNDLTAATGAPLANGDALPVGYVFEAQYTKHVIYTGADNHIHELWWDNSGWHHNDLTVAASAPSATSDTLLTGYVFDAQSTQHVVYRGYDNHIHELWWDIQGWYHNDLTAATGAPLVYVVAAGYVFAAQGTQHVFFDDGDINHVHELWWDSSGWHHNDLTVAASAPLIEPLYSVPAAYMFEDQGTQHVLYQAKGDPEPDGHVHELWWDTSGWHHHDLTAATGAPLANIDSTPQGYAFEAQGTQHVVYSTKDRRVIELYWVPD